MQFDDILIGYITERLLDLCLRRLIPWLKGIGKQNKRATTDAFDQVLYEIAQTNSLDLLPFIESSLTLITRLDSNASGMPDVPEWYRMRLTGWGQRAADHSKSASARPVIRRPPLPRPLGFRLTLSRKAAPIIVPDGFQAVFQVAGRKISIARGPIPPPDFNWQRRDPDYGVVVFVQKDFALDRTITFDTPVETSDHAICTGVKVKLTMRIDSEKFAEQPLRFKTYLSEDEFVEQWLKPHLQNVVAKTIDLPTWNSFARIEDAKRRDELEDFLEIVTQNLRAYIKDSKYVGVELMNIIFWDFCWSPDSRDRMSQTKRLQILEKRGHLVQSLLLGSWRPASNSVGSGSSKDILWQAKLKGKVRGRLGYNQGNLFVCTDVGHLYVIDRCGKASIGASTNGPTNLEAGVGVSDNYVCVASSRGHVWCLRRTDMNVLKVPLILTTEDPHLSGESVFRSEPVLKDNHAFFAYFSTGESNILRVDLSQPALSPQSIRCSCALSVLSPLQDLGSSLLFVDGWGSLYRLRYDDPSAPKPDMVHQANDIVYGGMALDSLHLVACIALRDSGLIAVDVIQGRLLGKAPLITDNDAVMATPTVHNDGAYVGTEQGYLLGLKVDGQPISGAPWRVSARSIRSRAVAWEHLLFVADTAGTLLAFDLEKNTIFWTYPTNAAVYAPVWVDVDAGIVVVANDAGVVTAIPWYYDQWQVAIEYYKQWGKFDVAAHLAFLHQQFDDAKSLWNQSSSTLGKALLAECEGDSQRAIQHYTNLITETDAPALKLEIERVIKSLQIAAGDEGFGAEPDRPPDSGSSASRPSSIWHIEQIHTPNIVLRTPGELYVRVQPRQGYETVAVIQAIMDLGGDVQTPILGKEISAEILRVLQQKGYFFVCLNITPSQLQESSLRLKIQYQSADGAHYETSQPLTVRVSAEPQPTYIFHAPANIVSGDGVIIVRGLGTDKTQTSQIIINEQQVELFRKSGKLDSALARS